MIEEMMGESMEASMGEGLADFATKVGYEHKTEERMTVYPDDGLKYMHEVEGWELVDFAHSPGGLFREEKYIYHFKRPLNFVENKERMRKREMEKNLHIETNIRSGHTKLWVALSHYRPDLFEMFILEESFDRVYQRSFDEIVGRKRSKEERKYSVGISTIINKLKEDKASIDDK